MGYAIRFENDAIRGKPMQKKNGNGEKAKKILLKSLFNKKMH